MDRQIKKYAIKSKHGIYVPFDGVDGVDRADCIINDCPETWLESDGHTIWVCQRRESISTANLIDMLLASGEIEEVHG